MKMRSTVDGGMSALVDEAETSAEREELEERAAVLSHVRHPGVVELVGAGWSDGGAWQLRTRWVGPDLTQLDLQPEAAEVAGLGAAVATTLADLHAIGWVHAAVEPAHILLDPEGRPVLCGLGSAHRSVDVAERTADTAALGRLLESLIPESARDAEWRAVRAALRPGRRGGMDAAKLARRLAAPGLSPRLLVPPTPTPAGLGPTGSATVAHPESRRRESKPVPDPSNTGVAAAVGASAEAGVDGDERSANGTIIGCTPRPPARPAAQAAAPGGPHPHEASAPAKLTARPPLRWFAGAAAATFAAVLWVGLASGHGGRPAVACPPVDGRCGPVSVPSGVLTTASGRFGVGAPGDTVVLGRWDCGPLGLPAILRRATGEIWVFDRWPAAGLDVAGRPVGRVAAAVSLAVVPSPTGCDRLRVLRAGEAPIVLSPEVAR